MGPIYDPMGFRDTRNTSRFILFAIYRKHYGGESQDLFNDIVEQASMKRFLANLAL